MSATAQEEEELRGDVFMIEIHSMQLQYLGSPLIIYTCMYIKVCAIIMQMQVKKARWRKKNAYRQGRL